MKIDEAEARNRLKQLKREIYTKSLFVGYYDDAIQVAINSINELDWYREQDLIRREDAIGEIEYECNCYQSEILHRRTITDVIEQIPKVEYGEIE